LLCVCVRVSVCLSVCVCVCTYVCMYVYMYIHTHTYIYTYVHMHIHISIHVYNRKICNKESAPTQDTASSTTFALNKPFPPLPPILLTPLPLSHVRPGRKGARKGVLAVDAAPPAPAFTPPNDLCPGVTPTLALACGKTPAPAAAAPEAADCTLEPADASPRAGDAARGVTREEWLEVRRGLGAGPGAAASPLRGPPLALFLPPADKRPGMAGEERRPRERGAPTADLRSPTPPDARGEAGRAAELLRMPARAGDELRLRASAALFAPAVCPGACEGPGDDPREEARPRLVARWEGPGDDPRCEARPRLVARGAGDAARLARRDAGRVSPPPPPPPPPPPSASASAHAVSDDMSSAVG